MTETTQQQPSAAEAAGAEASAAAPKAITSTQRVFDAVRDLRGQDQIASRETVADLTGIKMSVVDDRLRALVDDGKLKRLLRGIYELVETFPPPRPQSKTILSNGMVVIEIGDVVLHLTPSEDRTLALLQSGAAAQASIIETGKQHLYLATELAAKVEKLERTQAAMRALLRDKLGARQMDLLGSEA